MSDSSAVGPRLDGQIAIVTGAGRGIGTACARALVAAGCRVVLTDRSGSVETVASDLDEASPGCALARVGNVADADHVRAVVDDTVDRHGTIDILINNAGEARASGVSDSWSRAADDFHQMFGSNTLGAFLFGRAVAAVMARTDGGHIVNMSTDHVLPEPGASRRHGHGGMDLYNASKWALNGFLLDWAVTLRSSGIRVNNLCMGATDTPMLREFVGPDPDPGFVATWIRPDQIADVLVELLAEGPDGRSGHSIGLYAGSDISLPPRPTT